jgi:hypothetical protein
MEPQDTNLTDSNIIDVESTEAAPADLSVVAGEESSADLSVVATEEIAAGEKLS